MLSAARRTVSGRSSQYENLDYSDDATLQQAQSRMSPELRGVEGFISPVQELEMNSVSVVPDGKLNKTNMFQIVIE